MQYLIMIQSNERFLERFEALSEEERADFGEGHMRLSARLAESGELIASAGLAGPEHARRITNRDGQVSSVDGPFAEVKEHLAGFYLVDVDDAARADEIAASVPDAVWGLVEVRPAMTRADWDQ